MISHTNGPSKFYAFGRAEVDLQCGAASFSEGSGIHHDLEDSLLHLVNSVDIKRKIPYRVGRDS
jgi:hypothetical protein